MKKTIKAWAVVRPDKTMLIDTHLKTEKATKYAYSNSDWGTLKWAGYSVKRITISWEE